MLIHTHTGKPCWVMEFHLSLSGFSINQSGSTIISNLNAGHLGVVAHYRYKPSFLVPLRSEAVMGFIQVIPNPTKSHMIRWNPDSYKISPLATLYDIPNTSPFRIILPQPSSPAQPLLELPGAQTLAETHGHIYS